MALNEMRREATYDVTLARLRPRTMPAALDAVAGWLVGTEDGGTLVGCLFSELGIVNHLLLVRRFADTGALLEARRRILLGPDPFGISEYTLGMAMDIACALPLPAPSAEGMVAPFYEVRIDVTRPGSLDRVAGRWRAAVAEGTAAPRFGAYVVAGERESLLHIWPCRDLDAQAMAADEARASNIWRGTAPDGVLLSQRADIFRPAAFSPIG